MKKVLQGLLLSAAAVALLPVSAMSAPASCHQYVVKVSKQLDRCGRNKACLEQPFRFAMYQKNYGSKYLGCKITFSAEVKSRLEAPAIEDNILAGVPDQYSYQVSSCQKAFYFYAISTKRCENSDCLERQYKNTLKTRDFGHCTATLSRLKEARYLAMPGHHRHPVSGQVADSH